MRIALTGNPNSGKTTMYNALTGRSEKVGNWAGVTVDKKESPIKKEFCNGNDGLIAVDLPGAYSMSPFTSEESIASDYVKNENPDAIINIVDATNLSRSLFFTTQLGGEQTEARRLKQLPWKEDHPVHGAWTLFRYQYPSYHKSSERPRQYRWC